MEPTLIYDTTFRDGTQGEDVNFSAREKLKIAKKLDDIGVQYIEGGFAGSNPRDMAFFEMARDEQFNTARLAAFGSTRKPGVHVEEDANLKAVLETQAPVAAIVGKSWTLHVEQIMGNTLDENLAMIVESMAFLKAHDREVIFDSEHFFDGYKSDKSYALDSLRAAMEGGADFLVLCDTNGGTLPFEIETICRDVCGLLFSSTSPRVKLGIHTHNDCGLALANALAAVRAGAVMVQGTINGYGERCGNMDITSAIPVLCTKMSRPCIPMENLAKLKNLSRFVSETANMIPLNSRPFVGRSAFAHKGGMHVNAIMKMPEAYEHMKPEVVGNNRRVLVSDLSGKSNIEFKAKELGVPLGENGVDSRKIVDEIKQLEQDGYQFDVAEGSLKIRLEKLAGQFNPQFELETFRVTTEKSKDIPNAAHATIKVSVGDHEEITAAEGNGPVSALDNALRKVLENFYPEVKSMQLIDFKVRVIDGREGTAARVRVLIESRDQDEIWSTVGVSEDVLEASWQALADSFQYKLSKTVRP